MEINQILELQKIVQTNLNVEVNNFTLKNHLKLNKEDLNWVSEQILARQKSKHKIPNWFKNTNIIFPQAISIEQSSSEKTAEYKAKLYDGNSFIDLTGGMGIDSFYFAKSFKNGYYFELQESVFKTTKHNFKALNIQNIQIFNANSIEFLRNNEQKFDLIYLDPARRDSNKKKVFLLSDCEPNYLEVQQFLLEKTNQILIKCSPLLDISSILKELKFIKNIHIIAIENEVKEILIEIEKQYESEVKIKTVNISKNNEEFNFLINDETITEIHFSAALKYLYEPNAAIMKSGGFKSISKTFSLAKIAKNSHLYTSDRLIEFPGRCFEVLNQLKVDSKEIKKLIPSQKANLSIRNFPDSVEDLRKKLNLKDGGDLYIFATTDLTNKKILLVCKKIQKQ